LVLLGCVANEQYHRFQSSRFGPIAIAARYASDCNRRRSNDYAKVEIVNREAGLYFAMILPEPSSGMETRVLVQDGCFSRVFERSISTGEVQALLTQSSGVQGDYFVGQAIGDGTTYFVRSDPRTIEFAVYEPNNGNFGASTEEIQTFRNWARFAEALKDEFSR